MIPSSKISFRTSRSAGPGGQNVNKVESRVELLFDPERSAIFSSEQLSKIFEKLKKKIDSKGILHITSQSSRSQWENKEIALQEFVRLLRSSLKPEKKRIPTKPSKVTKEKRLKKKKVHSEKKQMRKSISLE
ncbi:MAG: alternative ribosome rescue aminoacyl-tRNA hydrolase ArfB [Candidatus Kryptoniota bacterium]